MSFVRTVSNSSLYHLFNSASSLCLILARFSDREASSTRVGSFKPSFESHRIFRTTQHRRSCETTEEFDYVLLFLQKSKYGVRRTRCKRNLMQENNPEIFQHSKHVRQSQQIALHQSTPFAPDIVLLHSS